VNNPKIILDKYTMTDQYKRADDDYVAVQTEKQPEDLTAIVQQQAKIIQKLIVRTTELERKLIRAQSDINEIERRIRRPFLSH
jgi:hypothetical protein